MIRGFREFKNQIDNAVRAVVGVVIITSSIERILKSIDTSLQSIDKSQRRQSACVTIYCPDCPADPKTETSPGYGLGYKPKCNRCKKDLSNAY